MPPLSAEYLQSPEGQLLREAEVFAFDMDGTLYEKTDDVNNQVRWKIVDTIATLTTSFNFINQDAFDRLGAEELDLRANIRKEYDEIFGDSDLGKTSGSTTVKLMLDKREILPSDQPDDLEELRAEIKDILATPLTQSEIKRKLTPEKKVGKAIMNYALNNAEVVKFIQPNLEINKLIADIRESGRQVGIVTSSPHDRAIQILSKLGYDTEQDFNFIFTVENGDKKSGQVYAELIASREVAPEKIVMIGDSLESDILGAKGEGLQAIYLTDEEDKNHTTIQSLQELELLLQ